TCCIAQITATYGVNKQQFFSVPSPTVFYVVMNTSRPLFKNNPKLRQAVNYAIDRTKLTAVIAPFAAVGSATDDYLPTVMPGYVDAHLYPLQHPDSGKPQSLPRGNTRSGKAGMY